jgi:hypothetical protein
MKKKYVRIPRVVSINCVDCGKRCRRKVPLDSSPGFFDCDKCGKRMNTPVASCCIICAYSGKKCAPTLKMEARIEGLELR